MKQASRYGIAFLFIYLLPASIYYSQNSKQDSLNIIISEAKSDTAVAAALAELTKIRYNTSPDTIIPLCRMALELIEKKLPGSNLKEKRSFLKTKATIFNTMSYALKQRGNIPSALEYLHKSLKIRESIQDKRGMASLFRSIGYVYMQQNDFDQALAYFNKCLKIRQEIGDRAGEAYILSDIGYNYRQQNNIAKAIEYFQKCYEIDKEIGDKTGMAYVLINIGYMYHYRGEPEKTLDYFEQSLAIQEELRDQPGIAYVLSNIGYIHWQMKNYQKAMDFYSRALSMRKMLNDLESSVFILNNIARVYFEQKQIPLAIAYADSALHLSQELGFPRNIRNASELLFKMYRALGEEGNIPAYKKALKYYQLFVQMRDSINNTETQKAAVRQEMNYKYEKEKLEIQKEQEKKEAVATAESKRQKVIIWAVSGGLLLLAVFAFFIFNRLRITRKQKAVIEEQKALVDEQNKEILDSITYARRIQSAILPPDKVVKKYLKNSFILYKPKDIVAGDFYWLAPLSPSIGGKQISSPDGGGQEGAVLFAAADCTGHGVPGAMVSVVCNNALNRSVREHGLTEPGKILDKAREIVIQEFEKSDEEVKDGMDISLCKLETCLPVGKVPNSKSQNSKTRLEWAGANNPLWLIRKGEILETKANKQPIGKFDNPSPYTTHAFDLQKDDTIYIFSDGYIDQFGGEKGKKFKTKAFRELLLSIQDRPMEEQKLLIDETFENWKGSLEQIDDICVIGVRI